MSSRKENVGLWMIGAGGAVAGTVALGVAALAKRLTPTTGLVTALAPFHTKNLVDPAAIAIGGHEVRKGTFLDSVRALHAQSNLFDASLIRACAPRLRAMQRNVRPGTLVGATASARALVDAPARGETTSPARTIKRLTDDMIAFRRRLRLDQLVVINVASSEPRLRRAPAQANFKKLQRELAREGSGVLPPSSLYALAAIEAGAAYINFTPSAGIEVPALRERALQVGVPFMGNDGKTGETLIKSVLAPLFVMRNLSVLGWVGQNILGNRDGFALRDPATRASKIASKDKVVSRIVGGQPTTHVSIDYVPSLDDWKVAWDFIHFEGFLQTKMSMQFVWQGSDSALAAPLIIDLTRLAALECRAGRAGPMSHLACFFKDPTNVTRHDLSSQWQSLLTHLAS